MDLYRFANKAATTLALKITQPEKERIVSTLRVAGILSVDDSNEKIAMRLFANKAKKMQEAKKNSFFRSATAKAADPKEKFQQIKDLKDKGVCPKCNKEAATAKLTDKEDVLFCQGCKATLWKD